MQIQALGCISHFLPIFPPVHQDHIPSSPLLLWGPEPWACLGWVSTERPLCPSRRTEGRCGPKSKLHQHLPQISLSGARNELTHAAGPLSLSMCLLQCSILSISAFLQCALMEWWLLGPKLFVQIKSNNLYAGEILTTLCPIVPFTGAPTQECRLVLLRWSLCFI